MRTSLKVASFILFFALFAVICPTYQTAQAADLVITATSVVEGASPERETGTAGATITAGQAVYKDSTDSYKLKLADADASLATSQMVGISLHAASSGQPLAYIKGGNLNPGATVTVGTLYVLSDTAGGIRPVADNGSGDYVTIIGVGTTSSNIRLQIYASGVQVP